MDSESADSMNSRTSWRGVLWLSRFLEQAEREAVVGDLAEYTDGGGGAIFDILGLVLRRRIAVLMDLRLWVAVAFLVLPVSYLLGEGKETCPETHVKVINR
jgi:hypothetical protein